MAVKYHQRLIALFLAAGLMSGCTAFPMEFEKSAQETPSESPGESPRESSQGSPSPQISLKIFQYKPELKDAFAEVIKKYSEGNSEVILNIESPKAGEDYHEALKARFNSGDEPDIFNISGPQDIVTWKDKLMDLSEAPAAQFAIEGLLKNVTVEGKVYGLPYELQGYGLVYNKEIFEKAQIDIKSIDSFQTLEIAVKKLDEQKKDLKLDAVFAFPAKEYVETGLYLSNLFISPEFEGDAFKAYFAKSVEFKYGEAFKKMVDLFHQYSVQPSYAMTYKKQLEELFIPGKVAIIPQGSWVSSTIEQLDKKMMDKVGFMPFPVEGHTKGDIAIGVPMYWAVNKSRGQEVQKAAEEFITWLYLTEDGQKSIKDYLKFLPPYKDFAADSITEPLSKYVISQANARHFVNWIFGAYPEDWGLKTLGPAISAYVQGKLSWDELIKNAKKDWESKRK